MENNDNIIKNENYSDNVNNNKDNNIENDENDEKIEDIPENSSNDNNNNNIEEGEIIEIPDDSNENVLIKITYENISRDFVNILNDYITQNFKIFEDNKKENISGTVTFYPDFVDNPIPLAPTNERYLF